MKKSSATCVATQNVISTREDSKMLPEESVSLDPLARGADAVDLELELKRRVVGQDEAVEKMCSVWQTYMAGLSAPGRPVANLLFLGPTGTGKTRIVEAISEILFDRDDCFIKIDCAEFQESHAIAKLMGAPTGYVGHKDTKPFITQEKLDRSHTKELKLSFVLFDEIEKAHPAFWDVLLAVLDKGKLTLSDGSVVDFSKTIVFMTSNLGARDMENAGKPLGFSGANPVVVADTRLEKVSQEAARKKFSPEFWNRLDATELVS